VDGRVWSAAGCEPERVRATDVRHRQVAQRRRRPRQDQESSRVADRRLHLQVGRRSAGARTYQGQEEVEGTQTTETFTTWEGGMSSDGQNVTEQN